MSDLSMQSADTRARWSPSHLLSNTHILNHNSSAVHDSCCYHCSTSGQTQLHRFYNSARPKWPEMQRYWRLLKPFGTVWWAFVSRNDATACRRQPRSAKVSALVEAMLTLHSVILTGHLAMHWLRACATSLGMSSAFMTYSWLEALRSPTALAVAPPPSQADLMHGRIRLQNLSLHSFLQHLFSKMQHMSESSARCLAGDLLQMVHEPDTSAIRSSHAERMQVQLPPPPNQHSKLQGNVLLV
jgi:hypothetical protein